MADFSLTEINDRITESSKFVDDLKGGMAQAIIGQDELVNKLIIAMLADGHILLEGVPGLAKTLMVKTLARLIKTDFQSTEIKLHERIPHKTPLHHKQIIIQARKFLK